MDLNDLRIDPEFEEKIPPLTEDEFLLLEQNIVVDGEVLDPLIIWNNTILDGHNRYRIADLLSYNILERKENRGAFDFVVIADKKRITRESFERWYAGQSKYRKLSDQTPEELEEIRMAEKKKEAPRLQVDSDKPCYNVRETAVLMDLTPDEVRRLIRDGKLAAKKYGASYIIRRESIAWWTTQQKLFAES